MNQWSDDIALFIQKANDFGVRMIMVGGGAVSFHGYQRHSADVDFWIDCTIENFAKLVQVFNAMDYEITAFPDKVLNREQNISVKFSPNDLSLELITNFSSTLSFDEAFRRAELSSIDSQSVLKWRVLSFDDLIESKLKAARPKDLLDIQELQKRRK